MYLPLSSASVVVYASEILVSIHYATQGYELQAECFIRNFKEKILHGPRRQFCVKSTIVLKHSDSLLNLLKYYVYIYLYIYICQCPKRRASLEHLLTEFVAAGYGKPTSAQHSNKQISAQNP